MSCVIIAEAGVNHNGSLKNAFELVEIAANSGADFIKFQTFNAESLTTKSVAQADYQVKNLRAATSQFDMLKKLELSHSDFLELARHCSAQNIQFLSTPFDESSLHFLVESSLISTIKIPSGEITNLFFLLQCAWTGLPVILSTGMATLGEVETALAALSWGYAKSKLIPSSQELFQCYQSQAGQQLLKEKVTLLHCTSEYPAPLESVHLNAMKTLREGFGLPTGYSDHTQGISISIAAAALGASVIEKHFTISRQMEGPDHKASLEPGELTELVNSIRQVEKALGHAQKLPSAEEHKTKQVARKRLVARSDIREGEVFTPKNVHFKRSSQGLCASRVFEILGQVSANAVPKDGAIYG